MEQQLNPLVVTTRMTMKLLSIGRSTFDKWVVSNRLTDLKLHPRKKMFAYSQVEALAKLPQTQLPQ